ncbi:hypothetical protein AB0F71_39315 [Kitasatospora sp. NPDC028055]|uniref:hypothetical protein n=1 Tax=Kitasatospora sp. NPDC028055 TaxID=3155653 RepID=UPI0033FC482F
MASHRAFVDLRLRALVDPRVDREPATENGYGSHGGEAVPSPALREADRVRQVVARFATTVDQGDVAGTLRMLCTEEAGEMADDDLPSGGGSPSADGPEPAASGPPVEISEVSVHGDVASAHVTRPGVDTTIYLRKEAGVWSLCASAAERLPAAASPSR